MITFTPDADFTWRVGDSEYGLTHIGWLDKRTGEIAFTPDNDYYPILSASDLRQIADKLDELNKLHAQSPQVTP